MILGKVSQDPIEFRALNRARQLPYHGYGKMWGSYTEVNRGPLAAEGRVTTRDTCHYTRTGCVIDPQAPWRNCAARKYLKYSIANVCSSL